MTDLATPLRPLVPRHHRTPDGWVRNVQSRPGGWVRLLSALPMYSSPRSSSGTLETSRPYPPPPEIAHVEYDRDVLQPHSELGVWSRYYLPSATYPSCPCVAGWSGCPGGLEIAIWEGNHPCLGVYDPPDDLLYTLPISLTGQELLDRHQVLGFPG